MGQVTGTRCEDAGRRNRDNKKRDKGEDARITWSADLTRILHYFIAVQIASRISSTLPEPGIFTYRGAPGAPLAAHSA